MTEQAQSEQEHFNAELDAIITQDEARMQALQGTDDSLRVAARINAGAHPSLTDAERERMRERVFEMATTLPKVAEPPVKRQRKRRSTNSMSRILQIVIVAVLIVGGLFFLRPTIEERLGIELNLPAVLPETTPEATAPVSIASATPTPTLTPTISTPETSVATQERLATATSTPTLMPTDTTTPTITVEPTTEFLTVDAEGNVRVRAGAGQEFDIVGIVEPGTSVIVLTNIEGAEWIEVRLEDGTEGWIASFLLSDEP